MFAVINRLKAIPGYTHGTVVSVHPTEFDALIADAQLHRRHRKGSHSQTSGALVVLPLAVRRHQGEHVRISDLVEGGWSDRRNATAAEPLATEKAAAPIVSAEMQGRAMPGAMARRLHRSPSTDRRSCHRELEAASDHHPSAT